MHFPTKLPLLILALLVGKVSGADELWANGRISAEQPFKAKIIGVRPGWDTIMMKEEDGKGRYCFASVGSTLSYKIVSPKEFDRAKQIKHGATFLTPPVEVGRFSWSMGIWLHGRRFGEKDAVTKYLESQER